MSIEHSIFWNTHSQVFLMMLGGYQLGTHQRLVPSGYHRNIDTYIWALSFILHVRPSGVGFTGFQPTLRLPLGLYPTLKTSWANISSKSNHNIMGTGGHLMSGQVLARYWLFSFHNQLDRLFEVIFLIFRPHRVSMPNSLWEFKLVGYQFDSQSHTLDYCSILGIGYEVVICL